MLLNDNYRVDMAMGPQGKNLINKAYRSTKSNAEEESTDSTNIDTEYLKMNQTLNSAQA